MISEIQVNASSNALSLNILITTIINTYFADHVCLMQLSDNYESAIALQQIPTVTYFVNSSTTTRESFNQTVKINEYERCMAFLITGRNISRMLTSLEDHLRYNRQERYNKRKYILILPEKSTFYFRELYFLIDILIVQREGENFYLMTHPYKGNHSEKPGDYKLLDVWTSNMSFLYGNELFPDKVHNQGGRVIRVAALDHLPFAYAETKRGFELSIAVEYCERYNATCDIQKDTEGWGFLNENFTGFGIQGKVVSDQIDIAIGAIFIVPRRLLFTDSSLLTAFVDVTCIVPKPIELRRWLSFIKVFDVTFWILTGLTFVFISISKTIIARFTDRKSNKNASKIQHQLIYTLALFVGQNFTDEKFYKSSIFRFAHANVQLFCILFLTMYTSTLLRTMVNPTYYRDIKTVKDLAESGLNWGQLDHPWKIPLRDDTRQDYLTVYHAFRKSTFEELEKFSKGDAFGFGVERLRRSIGIGEFIKDDIIHKYKIMSDSLYKPLSALQMRKHSVLIPSFNVLIQRAHEAGLFHYWETIATIYHLNMKVQNALIHPHKEQEIVILTTGHIKGPLVMWALGMSLATVVFLSELLINRNNKGRASNKEY